MVHAAGALSDAALTYGTWGTKCPYFGLLRGFGLSQAALLFGFQVRCKPDASPFQGVGLISCRIAESMAAIALSRCLYLRSISST